MNKRKTFWILITNTLILFLLAVGIFLLSVYFGEQTKDPDAYEFLGWFIMLGIMLLGFISGCAAFGYWISRRNENVKISLDS